MPNTKKVKPVTIRTWMIEVAPGKYVGAKRFGAVQAYETREFARHECRMLKDFAKLPRTAAVRRVTVSISVEA